MDPFLSDAARTALAYRESEHVPRIEYTPEEQEVWRTVWRGLAPLHDRYACRPYLEANQWLKLDREQVPQLADINDTLKGRTGFRMKPVPGLVSDRVFLGHLGRDYFLSTQYMRHHSTPLYTPEPDVVHEMVGHAATPYDPTQYQSRLFVAPSFEQLVEDLTGWLRKQYRATR
jgi:phenylalanine-4-hydroxylase